MLYVIYANDYNNLPQTNADGRRHLVRPTWPDTIYHRFAIDNFGGKRLRRSKWSWFFPKGQFE